MWDTVKDRSVSRHEDRTQISGTHGHEDTQLKTDQFADKYGTQLKTDQFADMRTHQYGTQLKTDQFADKRTLISVGHS